MRRFSAIYNREGFTLAEILVAISVLLIILVAAAPLFVHIVQASQANKIRLEATRLAGSEIERIRALPYKDVGNIGGSPHGVIERERAIVLNGVAFTVTTDVWWWDDPSDQIGGAGPGTDRIPYDYKRVRVSVTAPGLFTGAVVAQQDLDTLTSMEGAEEAFPGGNIRLTAQRGWKTGPEEIPVAGARVRLDTGPDAPKTLWTDNFGRALFAILREGDYTVSLTAPAGMMVRPDQLALSTTVTLGVTNELTVDMEHPARLSLRLRDCVTGAPVANRSGTVTLVRPYGGEQQFPFTTDTNGVIGDIFGPLWPVGGAPEGHPGAYSLRIHGVAGYTTYDMAQLHLNQVKPLLPDGRPWDGTFARPNTSLDLVVNLRPIFYREPDPSPFQPARVFNELAVTGGELALTTAGEEHDFRLSTTYAAVALPDRSYWRGYRFRVDVPLTVTHLIGGGNEAGFVCAIYEADGNRPTALLGSVNFSGSSRQQVVALTTSVDLVPGQDYIIAQGRNTGDGVHHRVGSINAGQIDNNTHLTGWFPSGGALRWNRTGPPGRIVNRNPNDTNESIRPDLGFLYRTAGYRPSGVKISNPIALSEFSTAPELRVRWEALTPSGTTLTVATAITNSTATPAGTAFVDVTNGALVHGIIPGDNLTGRYLWLRVTLTTGDPRQTPRLRWLEVSF